MSTQPRDVLKAGRTVGVTHKTQGSIWGRVTRVDGDFVVIQAAHTRFTLRINSITDAQVG